MTCDELKGYLFDSENITGRIREGIDIHCRTCPDCRSFFIADARLERLIRKSVQKVPVPKRLVRGIERDVKALEREENAGKRSQRIWKVLVPAFTAALLLFALSHPLTGSLSSPEKIARLAVGNHMENMKMMFRADGVNDITAWFEARLSYPVRLPGNLSAGYKITGGRKCSLGNKDVAYLFYNKNRKRASLFVIDPGDISFEMETNRTYRLPVEKNDVSLWKSNSAVYVLVEGVNGGA